MNVRHQGDSSSVNNQTQNAEERTDGSTQPSTASQEATEEGKGHEEQCDQIEHPSKPPHVEETGACRVVAMASAQTVRYIGSIGSPGMAGRRRWRGGTTVEVTITANIEVVPLGNGSGASDTSSVGAKEECLVERCCVCHSAEDDEPEQHQGSAEEDECN